MQHSRKCTCIIIVHIYTQTYTHFAYTVCVCLCLSVCLSVCLCLSLSVSVYLCLYLSVSLFIPTRPTFPRQKGTTSTVRRTTSSSSQRHPHLSRPAHPFRPCIRRSGAHWDWTVPFPCVLSCSPCHLPLPPTACRTPRPVEPTGRALIDPARPRPRPHPCCRPRSSPRTLRARRAPPGCSTPASFAARPPVAAAA